MNISNLNVISPNSISPVERRPVDPRRKTPLEEDAAFGSELLQAAAQPMRAETPLLPSLPKMEGGDVEKSKEGPVQADSIVELKSAPQSSPSGQLLKTEEQAKALTGKPFQSMAVSSQTYAGNPERSMDTLKAAASANTASAIAGLKPWSKDWIFEDRLEKPAIQPLISSPSQNPLQALAQLEQMIQSARSAAVVSESQGSAGMQQKVKPEAGANPSAAISQLMRGGAENASDVSEILSSSMQPGTPEGQLLFRNMGQALPEGTVQVKSNPSANGASALSGAEFLTTLNAVRDDSGRAQYDGSSNGDSRENRGQQGQAMAAPKLRVIEGGQHENVKKGGFRNSLAQAGMEVANQPHVQELRNAIAMPRPVEVTGHVTQGSMMQNRLSSEALLGLSTGIKSLKTQGGGEIRIRLKPENLGELHLKVVTSGNSVGLQIQASDERSKKILEDTMSHLKDSLASQNLTLGRVELSVASSQTAGNDLNCQEQQPSQQGFDSNLMGQNMNQQGQLGNQGNSSRRWEGLDSDLNASGAVSRGRGASRSAAGLAGQSVSAAASSGRNSRLDVMA